MKKNFFSLTLCLCFVLCISFVLSGCGVVPAAWVELDMEGYVYYSSNMYASGGHHVYLYEDATVCAEDTHRVDYKMAITFYPRILGPDNFIDGKNTTTVVDIGDRYYSMSIVISKHDFPDYETWKVYLNDTPLTPDSIYDGGTLYFLTFDHFTLVRGNPNGQINGFVNKIEYKA